LNSTIVDAYLINRERRYYQENLSEWLVMIEISLKDARNFILDAQGLRTSKPCKSVLDVARRIHNIQIDTISVVSRSHNLITFNRYSKYEDGSIWDYEKKGELFEYWSHAMCMMPIETYPFYAWRRKFYPSPRDKKWANKYIGM